ncbi:MAG: DNA glycosylase [Bacillota bacterium]|nr:DNA glycosylase [Bacillota bacterium]
MEYNGYKLVEIDGRVEVHGIRDFDLVQTFECGQCFRWNRNTDGSYTGVVNGKVTRVSLDLGVLTLTNCTIDDFTGFWYEYFDLGRDYGGIKKTLGFDPILKKSAEFGSGIRLLKQDIREVLISFILSANNRIPRIMKTVEELSKIFGEKLEYQDTTYYSFPQLEALSVTDLQRLEICKGGFRCKYIKGASQMVEQKKIDLLSLKSMEIGAAREELMQLPGVGPKVADCILLYSGTKYEVFPTDVWVKRVMEQLYFKRNAGFKEIQDFARQHFGELAGFAQQYLFYYARKNKIGV